MDKPLYSIIIFLQNTGKSTHTSRKKMSYGMAFVNSYSDLGPSLTVVTDIKIYVNINV